MFGGTGTKNLGNALSILPEVSSNGNVYFSWYHPIHVYLFSSPELYLCIYYRIIITIASNKAANLSFVLATVTKFCELTMHFRGAFLFY